MFTRHSALTLADILDSHPCSPLEPAAFTLEPYRHLGHAGHARIVSPRVRRRVADHTTLSPVPSGGRGKCRGNLTTGAAGLAFALTGQQQVTQIDT
jgi:hypothetical protein